MRCPGPVIELDFGVDLYQPARAEIRRDHPALFPPLDHCPLVMTGLGLIWGSSPFIPVHKGIRIRNLHKTKTHNKKEKR
jgi:hypothetical protein